MAEFVVATALRPGAIAIIQIHGDVEPVLARITGRSDWPPGRARLATLADIDEGIVARIDERTAQIMPHGGVRVVQRLAAWLAERGVVAGSAAGIDPQDAFPEALDRTEALALVALSRAASPLAVDLLLDQRRRWAARPRITGADRARSIRLNRLIDPPLVVVAGSPNVGKSTLSNALVGRSISITADRPGTTRDYTAGRIDLAGLVVDWHDTPGLRGTRDPIEAEAIRLAGGLIERADFIVAMTAPGTDWPALPREPDLRVINKCDLDPAPRSASGGGGAETLCVSALRGDGLAALVATIRDKLVPPGDLAHPGPWLFDERLESDSGADCAPGE